VDALGRPHLELAALGHHRLRLVGPHPGGVDDLPGADLDRPVVLQVPDGGPGDPLALPQEAGHPGPGGHQRAEVRRRAGDVHGVPGVVHLAVVVPDRADQRVLAQRRRGPQRAPPGQVPVPRQPALRPGRGRGRHHVVEHDPGADVRALPDPVLQRVEEGQRPGQVRGQLADDQAALPQRLVHQPEVQHLQVAQAAVQQLAGPARRAAGEVAPVDQADPEAAGGGVEGSSRAHHATTHDQDVELLGGQALQCGRAGIRGQCDSLHARHPSVPGYPARLS
jgi:hypothetical protein